MQLHTLLCSGSQGWQSRDVLLVYRMQAAAHVVPYATLMDVHVFSRAKLRFLTVLIISSIFDGQHDRVAAYS